MLKKISPCLWFDNQCEEAAKFYTSIFKNSKITKLQQIKNTGPNLDHNMALVEFELEGQSFIAFDGGPLFKFSEAISLSIDCESQEEVDYFWNKLTANGGQESMCGWLKDKFGLSWQVVPRRLPELISDPDPKKAKAAMEAMLQMKKIDIAKLEQAVAQA